MGKKLTIERVANEINKWRKTRAKYSKMPSHLFNLIGRLKNNYALSEIIETLKLSNGQANKLNREVISNNFIELPPIDMSPPSATIACKFTKTDGTVLKLCVLESQVSTLLERFLCCN